MTDTREALIEANVSAFLLQMGSAGGGDARRDSEITWTVGGSPLSYHNAVVRCQAGIERADALIDEWLAELRRREVAGSWHVSPSTTPHDLPRLLIAHGFDDAGDEPAMLADLSAPPREVSDRTLEIERARNDGAMSAYRDVLAAGFGEGPREAEWVTSVFRSIGLGDESAWRHYIGRVNGAAVSTVSLLVDAAVGGIFFVCTIPEARRRGFGAAITRHAMVEARAAGCATAILGASSMGYPVYQRLGFEEVFRYRLFEWSPDVAK